MLIYCEPIWGSTSYCRLQIIPVDLRNILFIVFQTNPIGRHFNAYKTMHCICLCYYWSEMFSYIQCMCSACPGCALANPTNKSSELVNHFPINAPFKVLFVDGYSAGRQSSFKGDKTYLIACCGMTGFAIMEPVKHTMSTTFASALMKIQLRFVLCHTIVLNKDTKFFGTFKEAYDLLQLNRHILLGNNHNPMMVKCINCYLNKGLKIMANEHGTVRIAKEAILLLLLYAWNSMPIPGTYLSRCFVTLGREFQFPINFSTNKHWELTSTPASVQSYARDLATHLTASRETAKILVKEQRAMHREFINSRQPHPRLYSVGNIVFAKRAVQSNAARGRVDKLSYPFTGPWKILQKLNRASYEIEHCLTKHINKKHLSALSPYPSEIIPFKPVNGADNQLGQLNKQVSGSPYIQAGIDGFKQPKPFHVSEHYLTTQTDIMPFHWPTLEEMNSKLFSPNNVYELSTIAVDENFLILYAGPPPSGPSPYSPTIPPANILAQKIVSSSDKLFFLSIPIGLGKVHEWRLVRVALKALMSSYPLCLTNGRYLVNFYICHPADSCCNAINQHYWLHCHHANDMNQPMSLTESHLLRPSNNSKSYGCCHNLLPYRSYINITHTNTHISGLFDFATIHRRKSRDRVCQAQWDTMKLYCNMFNNPIPRFGIPSHSVHVDRGAHTIYHCTDQANNLMSWAKCPDHRPVSPLYP